MSKNIAVFFKLIPFYFFLLSFALLQSCEFGLLDEVSTTAQTTTQSSEPSSGISSNSNESFDPFVDDSESPDGEGFGSGIDGDNLGDQLFAGKSTWENFSPEMKAKVNANLAAYPDRQALLSGNLPQGTFLTYMGVTTADTPVAATDCGEDFICFSKPTEAEMHTPSGSVPLEFVFNLEKLGGVTGINDAVAMVTVFGGEQENQGVGVESLFKPGAIQASSSPNSAQGTLVDPSTYGKKGVVKTNFLLPGEGVFDVVLTAYEFDRTQEGVHPEEKLVSKLFKVYRTGPPAIELLSAYVPDTNDCGAGGFGVLYEVPFKKLSQSNMEAETKLRSSCLGLKVRLKTPYSPGLQVKVENFTQTGAMSHFNVAGFNAPNGGASTENPVYDLIVGLSNGKNRVKVTASIPNFHSDDEPAPSDSFGFLVDNYYGAPQVKILHPTASSDIYEYNGNFSEQKTLISFCYSEMPVLGLKDAPVPMSNEGCVVPGGGQMPIANVKVSVNGRTAGKVNFAKSAKTAVGGFTTGVDSGPKSEGAIFYNASTGQFHVTFKPDFGVNSYVIKTNYNDLGEVNFKTGAFYYGEPLLLAQSGKVKESDTFTPRGLHVKLDSSLIEGPVKYIIQEYLSSEDTINSVLESFGSADNTAGYTCPEVIDPSTGQAVSSNGDTSLDFLYNNKYNLPDVKPAGIEKINLENLEFSDAGDYGMIKLRVKVDNFVGDAIQHKADIPLDQAIENLTFMPLRFDIETLVLNLGLAFEKRKDFDFDGDGESEKRLYLNIVEIPGEPVIGPETRGRGPEGRLVYINVNNNPMMEGHALLDNELSVLVGLFDNILKSSILCGVENGLNNRVTGTFTQDAIALENPLSIGDNMFRFDLDVQEMLGTDFNLESILGTNVELQLALGLLRGEVAISSKGIEVEVPTRANLPPSQLEKLVESIHGGTLGTVVRPVTSNTDAPNLDFNKNGGDDQNLGLALGEDVINQFLSTLPGIMPKEGLLIGPDFYRQIDAIPAADLLPNGTMILAEGLDLDRDGDPSNDDHLPVTLRVQLTQAPFVAFQRHHFIDWLSSIEDNLVNEEGADSLIKHVTTDRRYLRLSIPGVKLALFAQEAKGGLAEVCNANIADVISLRGGAITPARQGICPVPLDPAADMTTLAAADLPEAYVCENWLSYPKTGGDLIDAGSINTDLENPLPIFEIKANLRIYAEIKPMRREKLSEDYLCNCGTEVETKNVLRIKLVPEMGTNPAFQMSDVEVLQNNGSGKSDQDIIDNFQGLVSQAVGVHCQTFNEIRLPIPSSFGSSADPLLPDLDLRSIGLADHGVLPQIDIDSNKAFLSTLFSSGITVGDPHRTKPSN